MVLECRTDPGGKWYSHKHNGPGVSYETSGPCPAASHDITIFRGGTKKMAWLHGGNQVCTASDAYWKATCCWRFWIHWAFSRNKKLFARFKSRQETLFRGYKALGIMGGGPFRIRGYHCCNAVQYGEWQAFV
ncbi:hypothetical protein ACHAWO_004026 [Cyclotella atomus]|uniref:Uncharacterized protein n=1 Tax=Cyclotella atomus TaxID=382360 RepID=A0ABD3P1L5_9STRA